MPQYKLWSQVAGYFDGDGTIATSDISNRPYKMSLSLVFVDQSIDQIAALKGFFNLRGIRTSNVLKRSDGEACEIAISEFKSVKKTLRRMLLFLCKKEIEAQSALDYYEGKITGNQLLAVFKEEVKAGRRERRAHTVMLDVPYTRPDGDKIMKRLRNDRLRDAFGRYRARLTPRDFNSIRTEHFEQGKRICQLVKEYPRYSRETIRRVLGRGRGYIGVRGIGRVDTTDITLRDPRQAAH
jgi:hypothetical protein